MPLDSLICTCLVLVAQNFAGFKNSQSLRGRKSVTTLAGKILAIYKAYNYMLLVIAHLPLPTTVASPCLSDSPRAVNAGPVQIWQHRACAVRRGFAEQYIPARYGLRLLSLMKLGGLITVAGL